MEKYFSREDVQRALHANRTRIRYPYSSCKFAFSFNFDRRVFKLFLTGFLGQQRDRGVEGSRGNGASHHPQAHQHRPPRVDLQVLLVRSN